MKKLKNLLIVAIVLIAAICCANLCMETSPESAYADGEVMTARVNDNGNVSDYATFSEAVNASSKGATITLLENASFCGFESKNFTLDLNGKVLTSDSNLTISNNILTIIDSVGTGEFKVNQKLNINYNSIHFKSGKITASKSSLQLSVSGSNFYVEGGTIDGRIWSYNNASFNIASGSIYKIDVNGAKISVSGGEIEELCFRTNTSNVLSGGSIHKICFLDATSNFDELLQNGYAYKNSATGELITPSEMNDSTSVEIVACTHPSFTGDTCNYCAAICTHDSCDLSTGHCNTCDLTMGAVVGETKFYSTFAEAVASLDDSATTVKLFIDDEFCALENKNITLDLNGKTLGAPSDFSIDNSTLVIVDTSSGIGSLLIGGTATVTNSTLRPVRGSFDTSGDASKLLLSNNALLEMDSSSTFEVNVPTYVESASVKISMQSGLIGKLYIAENATFEISDNAVINSLHMFKTQRILGEGATVRSIFFEDGAEQNYRMLLPDGYAYQNSVSSSLIKLSDMAESVEIQVVACLHAGVDENTNCEYCGKKMYFKIESGSSVFYFDDFDSATTRLSDGDVMTVLNNFKMPIVSHTIAKNVTLNLNGKRLTDCGITFNSQIIVNDDVGGGYIAFTCSGGNVSVYGKDNTELSIDFATGSLKIYGGHIVSLYLYNGHKASEILPSGYTFMNPNENNRKLKWSEVQTASAPLIVGLCNHSDFDEDFICIYCNQTVDEKTAINAVKTHLETAKTELTEAIFQKADAETVSAKLAELEAAIEAAQTASEMFATSADDALRTELNGNISSAKDQAISAANEALTVAKEELKASLAQKASTEYVNGKVSDLEVAIANAKTLCKTFATSADDALRTELNDNISTAKDHAISVANEALTATKNELEAKISQKASASELETAIATLNTAISNAETVGKTYSDSQNQALKAELESSVASAKSEVMTAVAELTERLNSLENSSHKTADNLKTLQTAFIVFTVLLSLSVIALAVVLIVWKRRGHLSA